MSDLSVLFLGTGSPRATLERGGPAQLVRGGESSVLVDCGDGTIRQLLRAGIEPAEVTCVFFTHLHSDHTLGYGSFVLGGWPRGRAELRVWGPDGTGTFHRQLFGNIYAADIAYRLSLGMPGGGLTDARLTEIEDGWRGEVGGMRVRAARGVHAFTNLAYRFECGGKSLVISGDTAYTPALVELARGADLLVQDATVAPSPLFTVGRAATIYEKLRAYHTSPEQAGRIAREAGVGQLVLSHLLPGVDPADLVARAQQEFDGPVTVAEDLLEVTA